jgi:hypothetical protein
MVESPRQTREDFVSNGNTGPLGQPRGVGFGILMYIITLGIYSYFWSYKTAEELKKHTGDGIGGVIALVIQFVISPVNAFIFPSEIGKMYVKDGQTPPVNGWTGLWLFPGAILIIPAFVWWFKVQGSLNDYWKAKGAATA